MQRIFHKFATLALIGALGFSGATVRAQSESVLYSFSGGTDGRYPQGSMIMDKQGNLYGSTTYGGASGYGAVFEITP